jgi:transcriptional regulator with XRE-family HTH domain
MNKLREVRVVKRISQFQLRLQTGINETKISHIENGLVQPRQDEAKKLARALGITPKELFGDTKFLPIKRFNSPLLGRE